MQALKLLNRMFIGNALVPLGISIGPSEKSDFYFIFFKFLKTIYNSFNISEYYFLSDIGKSNKKFIKENNIENNHFLCFRHLIESIGAHTSGAILVRRLLYQATVDEYEATIPQVCNNLINMTKINMINDKQLKKI